MSALTNLPVTPLAGDPANGEWWGEAELVVPGDMLNLMAETDPARAREEFASLFRRIYPTATPEQVDHLAAGLLLYRDKLFTGGVLLQGVVSVPPEHPEAGGKAASWQFFAGAVPRPQAPSMLDPVVLARDSLGAVLDLERCYTESFETVMGQGAALMTVLEPLPGEADPSAPAGRSTNDRPEGERPEGERPQDAPAAGEQAERPGEAETAAVRDEVAALRAAITAAGTGGLGLTVLVSGSPELSRALVVVGLAFDYERVLEMSAVAAQIAVHSVLREYAGAGA